MCFLIRPAETRNFMVVGVILENFDAEIAEIVIAIPKIQ